MKMKKMNEKKKKTGLLRLLEIAGRKKWWLFGSMVLGIIATIALFVPLIAVYLIIIELAGNATDLAAINQSYVYRLGYICLAAVGAYGVLIFVSLMLSHIAAFNILYEIRIKLADKLSRLPMGYFTKTSTGKIKKVMSEDVERIEVFIAHHIPDVTSAIVFPLLLIIYLFIVDWRLALAALVPFPIAIAVQVMYSSSANKEKYKQYHNALEKMNATVVEYVRGMPVVKVFDQTVDAFVRLKKDIFAYRDFTKEITKQYSRIYPAFLTIISSSLFFIIPVATFLLTRSPSYEDFIPKVFLFMILGGGMFFPLFKLMWIGGFLMEMSTGVERIDNILSHPEIPEPNRPRMPRDASIEFKNVTFAYNDTSVLKDVSFTSKPNTMTALVGPSGAGKTTIGLLIARFWDINKGKIKVGDIGIDEMRIEDLMNHVSFVFQDGFMFFDTIEENIRMGNKTASEEEVIKAAKTAHCHDFIRKLPKGYKTFVGESGTYLSGGEQQRIALARAVLKDSPVVVLDEATAFADPENEAKILASFAQLTKGKTVIVIAHRLSTITNADQILVIDKGSIVERGKHEELISNKGLYLRMWEAYSRSRDWTIDVKGGLA